MTHSRPLDPTSRPQARTRGPGSVARHLRKPGGRTATSPEPPGGEVGAVNAGCRREGRSCTSAAPQTLVPVTVPARVFYLVQTFVDADRWDRFAHFCVPGIRCPAMRRVRESTVDGRSPPRI